jgi:hypothetical protein
MHILQSHNSNDTFVIVTNQNQDKAKAARTKHLRCDIPSPSPSSQPTSRRMRSRRSSTRRRHRQGSRASAKHTAKRPARFLGDDAANSMSDAVAGHHCGGLGRAEELDVMREGSQVILQRYLPGVGRAYVAADRVSYSNPPPSYPTCVWRTRSTGSLCRVCFNIIIIIEKRANTTHFDRVPWHRGKFLGGWGGQVSTVTSTTMRRTFRL